MNRDVTKRWRIGLGGFGVLVLAYGAFLMVDTVSPTRILGLASWLILALILHDGIIAMITFGVALGLRRAGRSLPVAVLAIIQGALVVGSVFAIIVLPAAYKKFLGTRNPTVLPLDYGPSFVILFAVIVVLTAVVIVAYYAFTRRQKNRPSISQA